MPERVTKEEKVVELAIAKAKEVLQQAKHLGQLELDEPLTGEEVKVKRPTFSLPTSQMEFFVLTAAMSSCAAQLLLIAAVAQNKKLHLRSGRTEGQKGS